MVIPELKCPKCDNRLNVLCLLSNPAHYECYCGSCNFKLSRSSRKDSYALITQEELDSYAAQMNTKAKCVVCQEERPIEDMLSVAFVDIGYTQQQGYVCKQHVSQLTFSGSISIGHKEEPAV